MSCRCSDIRDCERDLRVLQRALRDNGQLGQRIRTLAASGHAGDEQDERAYPVEESLRARMRQKTEEFSARALECILGCVRSASAAGRSCLIRVR